VRDLAQYYNTALINPEANSHGIALVAGLKNWPKLYWREDIISGVKSAHIGWLTTGTTKPYMMQVLNQSLPVLLTHDAKLVHQIAAFRAIGMGKVITTGMDDHHDAACLALVAMQHNMFDRHRGYKGRSGWSW